MAELEYFLVCRSLSVDIDTDELTFGGVLEDVFPIEFPYVLDRVVAVSSWRIAEHELNEDFQAILYVDIPGEEERVDFAMNLSRASHRYRAIQTLIEIPVFQAGTVKFEVHLNGVHAASHHVAIHPALEESEVKGIVEEADVSHPPSPGT